MNKVETRVEAVWDLEASALAPDAKARIREALVSRISADGTIRVVSQRHRSQSANREAAVDRLRALVAGALRPRRKRRPTARTPSSERERMEKKRRRSAMKRSRRPEKWDE